MKKLFVLIVVFVLLICTFGVAFAFNWEYVPEVCDTYTIQLSKYQAVAADIGNSFQKSVSVTARRGDIVYFSIEVYDKNGTSVNPGKINITDLANVAHLGNGLYSATVTGSRPLVTYVIEEKTNIQELLYNGSNIIVSGEAVIINEVKFIRTASGIVADVAYDGNALELTKKLAQLGIALEDIYSGRVCMSDDVLIQNFGKICKQQATIKWFGESVKIDVGNDVIGIPKTGDVSVVAYAVMAVVAAGVMFRR